MGIWAAGSWGLAGGLAAGLVELMTAVVNAGFAWPWRGRTEVGPRLFVFAGAVLLGALVAAATHDSMRGAWPAFVMGVGAPATVQGLLAGIEVRQSSPAPTPDSTPPVARPPREREQEVSKGGGGGAGR